MNLAILLTFLINQLTQTLNVDGGTIDYTYTLLGKIETFTDPNKNTTIFGYDSIGRLSSEIDPKGYTTGYNYDKNYNLIEKTTANGAAITYSYDKLNRLPQKVTPEQTYAFTYDSLSRLTNAINSSPSMGEDTGEGEIISNLSFGYDAIGQLIQSSLVASGSSLVNISYSYDSAGRKTGLTDSTGATNYGFDKANRTTSITDPQGNAFSIAYDAAGRRTSLTGPGGILRSYDYDNANRLLSLINKVNGVEIAPFAYEYNKVGNRQKITDIHGEHLAEYDETNRLLELTNALATGGNENFSYDKVGNRLCDVTQSYNPNELNQITSGTNGLSISYDANGNITHKTQDGITWSLTWASENRLIQASSSDGKVVEFQYDALGRRISKSLTTYDSCCYSPLKGIPLTTTQWIYDGDDILLEYNNGLLTSRYTHGPEIDEPLTKRDLTSGTNYYYHADALGSITAITDSSDSVIESYRYSSFGVPTIYDEDGLQINESSIGNFYLFTGREYNSKTDLYYYRARYYDPNIGAFISNDPIGFLDGPNRYSMAGNNPVNYTDPFGLFLTKWHRRMTTVSMEERGFSEGDIKAVSKANRYVDRLSNQMNNADHGMPGTEAETLLRAREHLRNAIDLENLGLHDEAMKELGYGSHLRQDLWSHEYQSAGWWAHMPFFGNDPDDALKHTDAYLNALRDTRAYIDEFLARTRKRRSCK